MTHPDGSGPVEAAPPTASIVIPIYGRIDLTLQCLASLEATVDLAAVEVIVVDNGSSDDSSAQIASRFRWAHLIVNDVNRGFAAGCNQGARAARSDVVVFLNNDTEARARWLEPLLDALGSPDGDVGIVGSKLLYPDGTIQHAGVLFVDDRRGSHRVLRPFHRWSAEPADRPGADVRVDLRAVTGAALAIHRDLFFAVGGFDEAYWNGYEDVELCLRVGALSKRIVYEPASVVVHHESQSGAERWLKDSENHRLLNDRWAGRCAVDVILRRDGAVFPGPQPRRIPEPRRRSSSPSIRWRGPVFGRDPHSRLGRELVVRLHEAGLPCDPVANERPELAAADDARLAPVLALALRGEPAAPDVTIQGPDAREWAVPADRSRWVVSDAWPLGHLPVDRVAVLRNDVDELWVPSPWFHGQAVASGVPAHKVRVSPVGIDLDRFTTAGPRFALRSEASTRLLFAGSAIREDGVDLALAAYLEAFTPSDDVVLVMQLWGGRTMYRDSAADDDIARLAARADVPAIEVIDAALGDDDMAALYRACTALVRPRRIETFGAELLEAMACGLPVMAPGWGPVLDLCEPASSYLIDTSERTYDREAGFAAPAGTFVAAEPSVAHLAALLREVHARPDDAAGRGRRAAAAVAGRDWRRVLPATIRHLSATRRRMPVRFDPLGPFDPATEPMVLDDPRSTTVLVEVDEAAGWQPLVEAFCAVVSDNDDLTLVAAVADDAMLAELGELTAPSGCDVLVVLTQGAPHQAAAAIAACDLVLAGTRRQSVERAARMGRRTLRDLRPEAIRELLKLVLVTS